MSEVAVVIPCLDLGRFVEEAVDSVLRQTWAASEIVVVDDGSSEALTRHVLGRLARPRVRLLRTANHGPAAARNHGIRATRAPLVACLDADDLLEPTYLEKTASRLLASPGFAFVTTALAAFGAAAYKWTPPEPTFARILAGGGPHSATLFRRELFEALGGFDAALPGFEDEDFWLRAVAGGWRGVVLAAPLLRHRVRPGSRYRAAIRADNHRAALRAIEARHAGAIAAAWSEVLIEKERFLVAQRDHHRALETRRLALLAEADRLSREISDLEAAIRALGGQPVERGDLAGPEPLSPLWGIDRGRPIDRVWIEEFLAAHRGDIRGRVLEVKDGHYARRFGGPAVTALDVLDVDPANGEAGVIADLARPLPLPDGRYDCILLTQTLGLVRDLATAVGELHRVLAPGGVLLATAPALGRVSHEDRGPDGDFWRFTPAGLRDVLCAVFDPALVEVEGRGNAPAAAGFLFGLGEDDLPAETVAARDPWVPVTVVARAVKPAVRIDAPPPRALVLCWHRVGGGGGAEHATPLARFLAQLDMLAARFRIVPLEEVTRIARGAPSAPGAVALTFDDGTLDHLAEVSPALLARGLPATFFVGLDGLDAPELPWWERLPPGSEAARRAYAAGLEERRALVAAAAPAAGSDGPRFLLASELVDLAGRPGHSIGSHTAHHLALPLRDDATVRAEIELALEELARRTGRPPLDIAWPYGEHTRREMALAAALEHRAGFSIGEAAVRPGLDPFGLPRLEIGDEDPEALARRLDALLAAG